MAAATVLWQTKVTPELDDRLSIIADSMGVNRQELVRVIVAQWLDNTLRSQSAIENIVNNMMQDISKISKLS